MDIFIKLVLFVHMFSFVLALGAGMVLARSGAIASGARDDQKPVYFQVVKVIGQNINIGIGLLWVTGLAMLWLKYDWGAGLSHWFWLKMVLVVILSAAAGIGSKARRLMIAGDASQAPKARLAGQVAIVTGLLAILSAIMTFG